MQDQSLEVFAFGVVDVDGVVLRLVQLVQDTHFAPHLCRRAENSQTEHLFVHRLRAGESEQYTSRAYLFNRLRIESLIATQGIFDSVAVFGKGGRV